VRPVGAVDLSKLTTRVSPLDEIPPRTLYEILRLRVDVFVVEQDCAFPDLDGRDLEPGARHLWIDEEGEVVGYARLLDEPAGGSTIGRVVTPLERRGSGLGAHLMREAITRVAYPIRLKAQQRLAGWYEQFGFAVSGDPFDEDGIAHVPMRLDRPPEDRLP
jgi:predicted GNAT family N-acyltransferase